MQLKIVNNVSKAEYIYGVRDREVSNLFYVLDLELDDDVPEGEYSYELKNNDDIISTGLIQIGDYKKEKQEYKNEKKYIIYGK